MSLKDATSALIVNNAATNAHVVNVRSLEHSYPVRALTRFIQTLLDEFSDVLSSNDTGHPGIDRSIGLYTPFLILTTDEKPNMAVTSIRDELDSLGQNLAQGEQEIKSEHNALSAKTGVEMDWQVSCNPSSTRKSCNTSRKIVSDPKVVASMLARLVTITSS